MNRIVLLIAVMALIVLGLWLYRRRHNSPQLDVEPHAAKEIRKALKR